MTDEPEDSRRTIAFEGIWAWIFILVDLGLGFFLGVKFHWLFQ